VSQRPSVPVHPVPSHCNRGEAKRCMLNAKHLQEMLSPLTLSPCCKMQKRYVDQHLPPSNLLLDKCHAGAAAAGTQEINRPEGKLGRAPKAYPPPGAHLDGVGAKHTFGGSCAASGDCRLNFSGTFEKKRRAGKLWLEPSHDQGV